ncbi:hypothetical protein POM88_016359 [Heracleum sosnowskyi]|uniref:Uncharacterized protein n=1 Tax=Heracleum sosnowskyi TaxID=360622 RepID=A0AAD8INP9_9APIA|nr:hypothetical protein POM88_016359 [Heracleum sosnowskyi]
MSEDSAAAASLAFRHICDDCGKKLCGSLDHLFQIYQRAVVGEGTFKFSADDSLHVVVYLQVYKLKKLPSDQAKKALEALCMPAVIPLHEIINRGPEVLGQKPSREVTVHIDRLANIFRYVNHPEAVADAVHSLWPIFKAIFDIIQLQYFKERIPWIRMHSWIRGFSRLLAMLLKRKIGILWNLQETIKKKLNSSEGVDGIEELVSGGKKSHGLGWLIGRHGSSLIKTSTQAPPQTDS